MPSEFENHDLSVFGVCSDDQEFSEQWRRLVRVAELENRLSTLRLLTPSPERSAEIVLKLDELREMAWMPPIVDDVAIQQLKVTVLNRARFRKELRVLLFSAGMLCAFVAIAWICGRFVR